MLLRLSSPLKKEKIIKLLEKYRVAAISPTLVDSVEELELALFLTNYSFKNKKNISRKFALEMLLWLTSTTDIRKAMKKNNFRSEDFIVVGNEDKEKVVELLKGKIKPLGLKKKADPLRLEKISLSRL